MAWIMYSTTTYSAGVDSQLAVTQNSIHETLHLRHLVLCMGHESMQTVKSRTQTTPAERVGVSINWHSWDTVAIDR